MSLKCREKFAGGKALLGNDKETSRKAQFVELYRYEFMALGSAKFWWDVGELDKEC